MTSFVQLKSLQIKNEIGGKNNNYEGNMKFNKKWI